MADWTRCTCACSSRRSLTMALNSVRGAAVPLRVLFSSRPGAMVLLLVSFA